MDHDHIGWKVWKLIARTISLTTNTFALRNPKASTAVVSQKFPNVPLGTWGNLGETTAVEVGWEKWRAEAQKREYL